jgi:hypothetical protein
MEGVMSQDLITTGSRVILCAEYRSSRGDEPEQLGYIGIVREIAKDGYATVEWDAGFESDEWVGFIARDTDLLTVPKTATAGDQL